MARSEPLFQKSVKLAAEHKGAYENPNVNLTFSDISKHITPAAHQLGLTGYDMKNNCDKIQLFLSPFIDSGELYNCAEGFTIEDFYSKEDIILNLIDEPSDYVLATIVTDILVTLQRYYEKHPLPKAKLRTLIVIDECRRIFPVQNGFMDHNPHVLMERFMTTRRGMGIFIYLTQEPQSIPVWITDNSAYFVIFPTSGISRKRGQEILNLNDAQTEFLDALPKQGTAVMRYRGFPRKFILQLPGDINVTPITKEETDEIMKPYIEQLHAGLKTKEQQQTEPKKNLRNSRSHERSLTR